MDEIRENFWNAFCKFDFKKVRMVMRLLEWTWTNSNDPPTIKEMQNLVEELFKDALKDLYSKKENFYQCEADGFMITIVKNKYVTIRFIPEYSTSQQNNIKK